MDTSHKRQQAARVAQDLTLLQEDALIGIMYEEFGKNKMKHLDYDKVKGFAFELQTDAAICASLDAEACGEGEAWEPSDAWITDMCRAFLNAQRDATKKERQGAFGGGRDVDYDPKNPHSRGSRPPPSSPTQRGTTQRGSPSARKRADAAPSNPFDTKLLSLALAASS